MLNPEKWPDWMLTGTSAPAGRLRLQVDRVAPHFRTATVVGEQGCLKVELARALHARSPLRNERFLVCRAGEFRPGLLERSDRVTVYMACAGELQEAQQTALLFWLRQARRAETRLIFGTEVSPRGLAVAGRLHPELSKLVAAVEIRLTPLRERVEDLPALLEHLEIDLDAMHRMQRHGWPGNLRELQEVVAGAVTRAGGGSIGTEHLPAFDNTPAPQEQTLRLEVVLRRHVLSVLEGCAGNKLRAAELLGISRSTLYRMLEAGQHG